MTAEWRDSYTTLTCDIWAFATNKESTLAPQKAPYDTSE